MMNRTVGIISCTCGSGATHLGIGLSNYLGSGLCQKTAYVNLDKCNKEDSYKDNKNETCITKNGVAFYVGCTEKNIPLLLNKEYQWMIFDFGNEYKKYREEYLRCDIKIVVLNLSLWHRDSSEKLMHILRGQEWGAIHPQYVCTFYETKEKKEFEKKFGEKVFEIPIFHHPFCIKKEQFDLMGSILSEAAAGKPVRKLYIPKKKAH